MLARYESPNVLWIDPAGGGLIVWERAKGANVWDAEGRKYLDLTAAFGVAAAGHANPRVIAAGQKQMGRLTHAMGDVHPHAGKAAYGARIKHDHFRLASLKTNRKNDFLQFRFLRRWKQRSRPRVFWPRRNAPSWRLRAAITVWDMAR